MANRTEKIFIYYNRHKTVQNNPLCGLSNRIDYLSSYKDCSISFVTFNGCIIITLKSLIIIRFLTGKYSSYNMFAYKYELHLKFKCNCISNKVDLLQSIFKNEGSPLKYEKTYCSSYHR